MNPWWLVAIVPGTVLVTAAVIFYFGRVCYGEGRAS